MTVRTTADHPMRLERSGPQLLEPGFCEIPGEQEAREKYEDCPGGEGEECAQLLVDLSVTGIGRAVPVEPFVPQSSVRRALLLVEIVFGHAFPPDKRPFTKPFPIYHSMAFRAAFSTEFCAMPSCRTAFEQSKNM